jgi:hypothetical protein
MLYEAKTLVAQHPRLALPIARLRGHGYPFGPDTEIVIEGFPRSATSFAVSAFELPQPRKPVIAHHVHAPAQVMAAAEAGVPALVLIRRPEDAVLSLVIRQPEMAVPAALNGYLRFYQPLLPYRDRIVVGTFQDVTSRFGDVMVRVNRRFGTSFVPFDHRPENVQRVLALIDEYTRPAVSDPEVLERVASRPSSARRDAKEDLRTTYRRRVPAPVRVRAERLYQAFTLLPAA